MTAESTVPVESRAADAGPAIAYRLDARKVSFAELRAAGPLWLALVAWVLFRIFRMRSSGSPDDPPVDSLSDFRVEAGSFPAEEAELLASQIEELGTLGFHEPVFFFIRDDLHRGKHWLVTFTHRSRPVAARIHRHLWWAPRVPKQTTFFEFVTEFENDDPVWSLSSKPDLASPPHIRTVRRTGANAADLLKVHLEEVGRSRSRAIAVLDGEEAVGTFERLHEEIRDFHVDRGVFQPAGAAPAAEETSRNPDVMAEIRRIQNTKTNWGATAIILVVSLIAFLAIGLPGISGWVRMGMLVGILLLHELGHFVAMKFFGYSNLRMFFIPGFGAAVSGQHYNVAAWKKVIVALMGPLPGIAISIPLAFAGAWTHQRFVVELAVMMLFLNGFNLLPILPLDGGRVAHVILFSRNFWLDAVFRVATALAFMGLAIPTKSPILIGLAAGPIAGLPRAIKLAEIARALRREGFSPESRDGRTIPAEAADTIIDRIRAKFSRPIHPRLLAQQTLGVFEDLNTRPPGVLASASLLLLYAGSFGAVTLLAVVLVMTGRAKAMDTARDDAQRPQHSLVPEKIRRSGSSAGERSFVAATSAGGGRDLFERATALAKPGESVTMLGDTVLVSVPKDDLARQRAWAEALAGPSVVVDCEGERAGLMFNFAATVPDAAQATKLDQEFGDFFALPGNSKLLPPWAGSPSAEVRRARDLYLRLEKVETDDDPEMQSMNKEFMDLRLDPEKRQALTKRFVARRRELHEAAVRKTIEELGSEPERKMAQEYLELIQSAPPASIFEKETELFAPRLGRAGTEQEWVCAGDGYCFVEGQEIFISGLRFNDPSRGPEVLAKWLLENGCRDVRYGVGAVDPDD
ncbi:MAG: site-2 protease family protein [Phycisphaerales bacterium]|nr:site-2 protease family protein [Planctomycetota bacterium]